MRPSNTPSPTNPGFSWSVFVFFNVLNCLNVLNGLNSSLARRDRAQPSR
jgi:hypothetical protein